MLPAEAALFDQVNASYIALTSRIAANPNALAACSHEGCLKDLEAMNSE
jgi:hypothetical protein